MRLGRKHIFFHDTCLSPDALDVRRNLGFLCLLIQLNRLADFSALPALALARVYAVTIWTPCRPRRRTCLRTRYLSPSCRWSLVDGLLTEGRREDYKRASMIDKPTPEICFRFSGVICQLTRSEELDLASLAHGKTRRLPFAF